MIHYIYIHGFGDSYNWLRRAAVRHWQQSGVRVTLVPMQWSDTTETFEQKYSRIVATVNPGDDSTILVGESAGGAMALLVYMRQASRITSVITICGYNHTAANISDSYRRRHPAFYPLVKTVDSKLPALTLAQRAQITTLYSQRDHVVSATYSLIQHARSKQLPALGHFTSIAYVLIKGVRVLHDKGHSYGV